MDYFNVFIPVISLLCNIGAQVFLYKYLLRPRLLMSEYLGFLCGGLLLVICQAFAYDGTAIESFFLICTNLIVYFCLSYCYFHFVNLGETARRIRLLRELYESPGGLSREEVLARYNAQEVVNIRISRLVSNGQLAVRGGRYFIAAPIMLFISRAMVLLKLAVLGKKSEFEDYDK